MSDAELDNISRIAELKRDRAELLAVLNKVEQTMRDHNAVPGRCDFDFGEGYGGTLDVVREVLLKMGATSEFDSKDHPTNRRETD